MSEPRKRCKTCHRLFKRSNPANARYWLLLHLISDNLKPEGEAHTAEVWHQYFKQRYLGMDEVRLPNKKVIQTPKSSAELDTQEFAEYMAKVEQWGIEHKVYMEEMEPT